MNSLPLQSFLVPTESSFRIFFVWLQPPVSSSPPLSPFIFFLSDLLLFLFFILPYTLLYRAPHGQCVSPCTEAHCGSPPRHIFKLATLAWMRLLFVVSEHFRACLFLCLASHCFPGYFVIIPMSFIYNKKTLCRCSCVGACVQVCHSLCVSIGPRVSQPVCEHRSMYVTACV